MSFSFWLDRLTKAILAIVFAGIFDEIQGASLCCEEKCDDSSWEDQTSCCLKNLVYL